MGGVVPGQEPGGRRQRRGDARDVEKLGVVVADDCGGNGQYVAAAAFSLPWMAWAWIPLSFVIVLAGVLVELDPLVATAGSAAVLVVVGLLRGAARPAMTLEAAGLLLYGSIAVGALLLAPTAGLVVVALTLVAHEFWDIWHLLRHRDLVSPSLAEACVALDVPLPPRGAQALEQHAFVRSVLIDEQQPVLRLEHEVGSEQR